MQDGSKPKKKRPGNPNFVKGVSGNPAGKKPGTKNKFPGALKDKVLHACGVLESEGKDLASCAIKDPEWFWETFVKPMLPKELWVSGTDGKPFSMTINIERKNSDS